MNKEFNDVMLSLFVGIMCVVLIDQIIQKPRILTIVKA